MKKFKKDCLLWGVPHSGAEKEEILLQSMMNSIVRQAAPLKTMEVCGEL